MVQQTLSVRQAANLRGCSLKAILDLLYAKRLRGAKKLDRQWRIPRIALEDYDRRRTHMKTALQPDSGGNT